MLNPDNLIHEHIRQSKPDSGLGFQVKLLKPFQVVHSSLVEHAARPSGEGLSFNPGENV